MNKKKSNFWLWKFIIGLIGMVPIIYFSECAMPFYDFHVRKTDHLKYFGFAFVDCGIDDPFDNTLKTNYISEVAAFSNVAHMCVSDPNDLIIDRLQLMYENGVKAGLSVQDLFFVSVSNNSDRMSYDLRPDYLERWNQFVVKNNLTQMISVIQVFYVFDEPAWNGVTYFEIKTVADTIKASFPSIPTLIVEAYAAIDELRVPSSIDWLAFNRYGVFDPNTDPQYRKELRVIKSKRTRSLQRVVIIMDGWWNRDLHGTVGITESDMAAVATNYYQLAKNDPDVIGIAVHLWPGGLEDPEEKGVRNLPRQVIDEHIRIGKIITGK